MCNGEAEAIIAAAWLAYADHSGEVVGPATGEGRFVGPVNVGRCSRAGAEVVRCAVLFRLVRNIELLV